MEDQLFAAQQELNKWRAYTGDNAEEKINELQSKICDLEEQIRKLKVTSGPVPERDRVRGAEREGKRARERERGIE